MRDRKRVVNFGVVKRLSRRENEFALPSPRWPRLRAWDRDHRTGALTIGTCGLVEKRRAEALGAPLPVRVSGLTTEETAGICLCQVAHACCSVLYGPDRPARLERLRDSSLRIICVFGQILQQFKKGWCLAHEQAHGGQETNHGHRRPPGLGWSNDRTWRKLRA